LAMEIPILATDAPPLANLASSGLVELLAGTPLDQKIDEIFSNYGEFKQRAIENRKTFLAEYSYAATAPRIESIILPLLERTPPVAREFEDLLKFHREMFSSLPPSDVQVSTEDTQLGVSLASRAGTEKANLGKQTFDVERSPTYVDDKYDIVFFWKQNDTGIYGRRQDMIVKYLSKSPKVNRIVHFDAPIEATALRSLLNLGPGEKPSQSNLVYSQTVSRLLGLEHSEKVKHYTFVYGPLSSSAGQMAPRPVLRRKDYPRYVKDVLRENGIGRRRTIFWVCPVNYDFPSIARAFDPDLIVADVIDDHRAWSEPSSEQWKKKSRNYEKILGMSDLVLTNCQPAKQAMLAYADEIHVVPNAVELPEADETRQARPEELKRMKGPILGYVGNLSSRIDIDLLEYVARARPEWNIALIGSAHLSKDILRLDAYDNVHFLGVKRYSEVRQYIGNFDVAIIPHVDDEMTRSMNPLKLFVYASMNVPIVSTKIANLDELRELVGVALTKEDFVRKVEAVLHEGKPAPSDKRMRLLKQNSWDERVDTILKLIDEKALANV
jgi:Glycosyl transferases group 1